MLVMLKLSRVGPKPLLRPEEEIIGITSSFVAFLLGMINNNLHKVATIHCHCKTSAHFLVV